MTKAFAGNFTQQEAIPEPAIARAVEIMRSGRLHRYNTVADEIAETVQLELEFARYMGKKYCLAVTSGGYAMATVLRALGVANGEPVLTNAFTLSPVPGAIAAVSGHPVFVETTADLVIDFGDLAAKAEATKARILLLSHMRGHIADMDRLMALCNDSGLIVIEDCAHTMGAGWNGVKSGRHGLAGCYSTQTYKHMNSGEGGFIISDDEVLMAKATIISGSYMLYDFHTAGPGAEAFEDIRYEMPNCSGRMDNLRAAILRPQLGTLDARCKKWNERYRAVESALSNLPGLMLPYRPAEEHYVGSSIQFLVIGLNSFGIAHFLQRTHSRGVEIKWFGASKPEGYTSRFESWHYAGQQNMPKTTCVLKYLCDMRLPLTFSLEDCTMIGAIIRDSFLESLRAQMRGESFRSDVCPPFLGVN